MDLGTPDLFARSRPEQPAITMEPGGDVVSYGELRDRSLALAARLRADGIAAGDSVGILSENRWEMLVAAWAARRSGLRYTAISTHSTSELLAYLLADSEATAVFTSARFADLVGEAAPTAVRSYVLEGPADFDAPRPAPEAVELEGVDMLYSSGTTGRPKGVETELTGLPFGRAPDPVATLLGSRWGFDSDTVYLSPAPLYHAAPLRFSMATHRHGGSVVVMERFDPVEMLEIVERHRITHVQLVPTMMVRLLRLDPAVRGAHDLSSLRVLIHAAAPCPVTVKQGMIDWLGPIVHEYYSATENYLFTAIDPVEATERPGSVGRPLIGTPHVMDGDRELPAGEIGEIWSEGGASFDYHRAPEKTAASRNPRGWSTVGDVGFLDEDGYLFLTDRKADMVISGGVNVYPAEVENVLIRDERVVDCAVIGVPDDDLGERLIAVVVASEPGTEELAGELVARCRADLGAVRCPRQVEFVDELPRLPTGKLLKRVLRDRFGAREGS